MTSSNADTIDNLMNATQILCVHPSQVATPSPLIAILRQISDIILEPRSLPALAWVHPGHGTPGNRAEAFVIHATPHQHRLSWAGSRPSKKTSCCQWRPYILTLVYGFRYFMYPESGYSDSIIDGPWVKSMFVTHGNSNRIHKYSGNLIKRCILGCYGHS